MDLNLKVVNQQASETGTSFKRKSSFRRVGELCDRVVQFYFSEVAQVRTSMVAANEIPSMF
ncbi:hypothetical protein HUJ05_009073 [Dendroctonus ponderosae]|nr:hypothetical protein HUJ05_009073 [Dendroctonus ponderosae]